MLRVLAFIYGKIVGLRNYLYDRGILDTFDLGALTISIGNITAGGTGKTPLVAYVADVLASRGETVCILTRGYGRAEPKTRVLVCDLEQIFADPFAAGDEPYEVAQKLLGKAIVIADADRVAAAEWARRRFGVTAFVLDDGFQHRRARRDVDIVCIDATDPFGDGGMLPAGRLREPTAGLARAGAVVITRSDLVDDISNLRSEISNLVGSDCAVFTAENKLIGMVGLEEFAAKAKGQKPYMAGRPAFAFCGVGNPESFFELLRRASFDPSGTEAFRDHHIYTQQDIVNIEGQARLSGAAVLVTTAKDAVKLLDLKFELPCYVVEIGMTVDDPDGFDEML